MTVFLLDYYCSSEFVWFFSDDLYLYRFIFMTVFLLDYYCSSEFVCFFSDDSSEVTAHSRVSQQEAQKTAAPRFVANFYHFIFTTFISFLRLHYC